MSTTHCNWSNKHVEYLVLTLQAKLIKSLSLISVSTWMLQSTHISSYIFLLKSLCSCYLQIYT